jgi:peptidyl-prolyl cis-trans isomerase C
LSPFLPDVISFRGCVFASRQDGEDRFEDPPTRTQHEIYQRSSPNPVKSNLRLAAVIFALLWASYVVAQTTGLTTGQTAGQTQAKPKPAIPPDPAAKPAVKTDELDEPIPPPAPNALFPSLVARVNGKPVLGRDLEQRVRTELSTIGNPAWKDLRDDYKVEVTSRLLAQLVGDELLYQKAVASGVAATPAETQAEFDKVAKTYPSDAALNTELSNWGMDRRALSRVLSKTLIIQKYIKENITKKLVVTPAEIEDYYKTHPDEFKHPDLIRTSHILISVPQGATPDQDKSAKQRAEALFERTRKGEDFAKLAKENSMDPSASQGGDIGLTENGELEAAYEEAAAKLKVGEIGGVVKTSYGYHIIKLTDRKKAGSATLDEVRAQLTEFLKNQKEDAEVARLVKTLQSQAKVEVLIKIG